MDLLKGAMAELTIADPRWLTTDIGPVIDSEALSILKKHVTSMKMKFELIYQCKLSAECHNGSFMPPTVLAIDTIASLPQEIFGPILHVVRYKQNELDEVIRQINQTVDYIRNRVHVGNCYVNRTMIGAVVGLQPFGGEGLSGTGPKAGGPYYLLRLCHERTFTVDTTAAGGNASLMALAEIE